MLVDGKMTFENKVAAVFDLVDGIEARQIDSRPRSRLENFGPTISVQ